MNLLISFVGEVFLRLLRCRDFFPIFSFSQPLFLKLCLEKRHFDESTLEALVSPESELDLKLRLASFGVGQDTLLSEALVSLTMNIPETLVSTGYLLDLLQNLLVVINDVLRD